MKPLIAPMVHLATPLTIKAEPNVPLPVNVSLPENVSVPPMVPASVGELFRTTEPVPVVPALAIKVLS